MGRQGERGQSAVEYAGLLALLALVLVALFSLDLPHKIRVAVSVAVCEVSGADDCPSLGGGDERARTRLARRLDPDGDGLSSREERRLGTSPRDSDSDGDGIPDGTEVRSKLNPRSRDTDRDGIEDAREVQLARTEGTDPRKADSDADGLPDGAELALGTPADEGDADRDGLGGRTDGLSDSEEVYRYGTDPTRIDTDGDGVGDGDEVRAGSNPLVDERSLGTKVAIGVTGFFLDDPTNLSPKGILRGLGKGLGKLGVKLGIRKVDDAARSPAENSAAARKRRQAADEAAPPKKEAKPSPTPRPSPPPQPAATPGGGPGRFERENEGMKERAARYQQQVTNTPPGQVYRVGGVKFDGFENGVLLDAKGPGYKNLVKDGEFRRPFRVRADLVDQARRQLDAAAGTPVVWRVAEPEALAAMKRLFREQGIKGIRLEHVPPG